jgi:hypothetical protein
MKQEIKEKWVAALRSGEYEQTTAALHRLAPSGDPDSQRPQPGYCCLGVLCDLALKAGVITSRVQGALEVYDVEDDATLPRSVAEWADFQLAVPNFDYAYRIGGYFDDQGVSHALTELNDGGMSFAEIADIIERQF